MTLAGSTGRQDITVAAPKWSFPMKHFPSILKNAGFSVLLSSAPGKGPNLSASVFLHVISRLPGRKTLMLAALLRIADGLDYLAYRIGF